MTTSAYLNFILEIKSVPRRIRTDCGTENSVLAAIQCFFRREHTDEFAGDKTYIWIVPLQQTDRSLVVMSET